MTTAEYFDIEATHPTTGQRVLLARSVDQEKAHQYLTVLPSLSEPRAFGRDSVGLVPASRPCRPLELSRDPKGPRRAHPPKDAFSDLLDQGHHYEGLTWRMESPDPSLRQEIVSDLMTHQDAFQYVAGVACGLEPSADQDHLISCQEAIRKLMSTT